MQSENPFSTYHLWNANQNKGPKHYSDFMEAQQSRFQQMKARSDAWMEQQPFDSPIFSSGLTSQPNSFFNVQPQSPAMAQARKKKKTSYFFSGSDPSAIDQTYKLEAAQLGQMGVNPDDMFENNPYYTNDPNALAEYKRQRKENLNNYPNY